MDDPSNSIISEVLQDQDRKHSTEKVENRYDKGKSTTDVEAFLDSLPPSSQINSTQSTGDIPISSPQSSPELTRKDKPIRSCLSMAKLNPRPKTVSFAPDVPPDHEGIDNSHPNMHISLHDKRPESNETLSFSPPTRSRSRSLSGRANAQSHMEGISLRRRHSFNEPDIRVHEGTSFDEESSILESFQSLHPLHCNAHSAPIPRISSEGYIIQPSGLSGIHGKSILRESLTLPLKAIQALAQNLTAEIDKNTSLVHSCMHDAAYPQNRPPTAQEDHKVKVGPQCLHATVPIVPQTHSLVPSSLVNWSWTSSFIISAPIVFSIVLDNLI